MLLQKNVLRRQRKNTFHLCESLSNNLLAQTHCLDTILELIFLLFKPLLSHLLHKGYFLNLGSFCCPITISRTLKTL